MVGMSHTEEVICSSTVPTWEDSWHIKRLHIGYLIQRIRKEADRHLNQDSLGY